MKRLALYFLATSLLFVSCSTEQTDNKPKQLLKSYQISKNAQGKYSIDYSVNENVSAEFVKNIKTKMNEIHLFSDTNTSKADFNNSLSVERNQLKIGFSENSAKRNSIVIEDTDIVLARGEESNEYLKKYDVTSNDNKNYRFNFTVKEGIVVEFTYNEEENINEIHLKQGKSGELTFSKTYAKNSDVLKVDFVNHYHATGARTEDMAYSSDTRVSKRPRWIIEGGRQ